VNRDQFIQRFEQQVYLIESRRNLTENVIAEIHAMSLLIDVLEAEKDEQASCLREVL